MPFRKLRFAALCAALLTLGACQTVGEDDEGRPPRIASVINPDMTTSIGSEREAIAAACEAMRERRPAANRCRLTWASRTDEGDWYVGEPVNDEGIGGGGVIISRRDGHIIRDVVSL